MGMTIADNIDFLNEAKKLFEDIANDPSINETVKTYCAIESLESAIDTMHKYQRIEEIVGNYGFDTSWICLKKIREVIEDGNNTTNS